MGKRHRSKSLIMASGQDVMFLVGAFHLVGENNLFALLEKEGLLFEKYIMPEPGLELADSRTITVPPASDQLQTTGLHEENLGVQGVERTTSLTDQTLQHAERSLQGESPTEVATATGVTPASDPNIMSLSMDAPITDTELVY